MSYYKKKTKQNTAVQLGMSETTVKCRRENVIKSQRKSALRLLKRYL